MSNEEYEDDEDNEYDEEGEDDESNLGHDVCVDWTIVLSNTAIKQPLRLYDTFDNESSYSYELYTPPDSDVKDGMKRFPTFKDTIKFEIGMMFKDKL